MFDPKAFSFFLKLLRAKTEGRLSLTTDTPQAKVKIAVYDQIIELELQELLDSISSMKAPPPKGPPPGYTDLATIEFPTG